MNKTLKKLKRTKPILRYLYYLIIIIYVVSFFFFIKSLLTLNGIETTLRLVLILFFVLYLLFYIFYNLLNLPKRKNKRFFITSVITLLFIAAFCFVSYYIDIIYKNLDNITEKDELLYTSYVITLKDNNFDNNSEIGLISEDIEAKDYYLASQLYKKEKLANSIKDYNDYFSLLNDLYNENIDAIFVPGNYVTLFKNEEMYEGIATDTKIIFKYSEKMTNEDIVLSSNKTFNEPLTILLMGVDSTEEGLDAASSFNGDTLMVVTINPKTLDAVMLSIPRDTYVPIACNNNKYFKINSAAAYGTNCVVSTINKLLDINIDYYAKINFKGVVELVDALGGIEVDVEAPTYNYYLGQKFEGRMCEQNSNREFGDNLVCVDAGWQKLNGEQALAYSRNRHLYIEGDLDRIRHQQQVVEAILKKALQSLSINDFQKILSAISNNIATNMEMNTILSGYQVAKGMIGNLISGKDALNINKATLETYSLPVYVPYLNMKLSAQGYYTSSLEDIKNALKVTLGLEKKEIIKTFSFNVNEIYEAYSPGKNLRSGASTSTLPNFIGSEVAKAQEYASTHNINLNIEYVASGDAHYNSEVSVGLIADQSERIGTLVQEVKNLTIYIASSTESNNTLKEDNEQKNEDKVIDDEIINDIILGE